MINREDAISKADQALAMTAFALVLITYGLWYLTRADNITWYWTCVFVLPAVISIIATLVVWWKFIAYRNSFQESMSRKLVE